MAASRTSPATDPESLRSGKWWDAEDFRSIRKAAAECRAAGDLAGLEIVCQTGLDVARLQGNQSAQIGYLTAIGNSRLQRFQYGSALEAYLEASHVAEVAGDWMDFGAISGNLSSVYQQAGDLSSALSVAERGRSAIQHLYPQPFYSAQLLLQLGRLHATLRDGSASRYFLEGIDAARLQDDQTLENHAWDVTAEAQAWDLLGMEHLSNGNLAEADTAITEAARLRLLFEPKDLAFSYWRLGTLRLDQARPREAERLTQRAMEVEKASGYGPPLYLLLHQRGRAREALGQTVAAIEDFAAAVESAAAWRLDVPTATSSLTAADVELDHRVFVSFVDTAARSALRTGDVRLARQGFLASELNRAASLRETKDLAEVWHRKLPPTFWEKLGKLRSLQARLIQDQEPSDAETQRLGLELTEMEAVAGLGFPLKITESFRSESSLNHFQKGLSDSELLLSFHLGEEESYLWAVTRTSFSLYRLPAEKRILTDVEAFRAAVVEDRPSSRELGEKLYRTLFKGLTPREADRKSWLLSLEGSFFELPFAALVPEQRNGKAVYLVEKHSLQVIPGALLLSRDAGQPANRYLAVEDPIYNSADPRTKRTAARAPPLAVAAETPGQLTRLVASRREVEESRRNWQHAEVQVLEGADARKNAFLRALSPVPGVIHLATHVLARPSQLDQAFLAFSLGIDQAPELLGTSEIAMLRVPGSVVVMTGCASASGEVLDGAGSLGLTRAWLAAGASAVVATGWPVADSRGDLLPAFYSYLGKSVPAEALRRSQMQMLAAGNWQAAPQYWASFQVTGGAR